MDEVKKINNPDYHKQEEGRGWSYSFNKTNASFIHGMTSISPYKKYLNMNDEQAKNQLKIHRGFSDHKMKDISINDNFYNCVGTYKVKKKDIMFMTDEWGEMEIVINPKKVKLLYHRPLNIIDNMTFKFVYFDIFKEVGKKWSCKYRLFL